MLTFVMEDLVATKQQLEARVAQLNEARSLLQDQAARLEQTSIGFLHKQVAQSQNCYQWLANVWTAGNKSFCFIMASCSSLALIVLLFTQELCVARKEINSLQLENSELRREVHRWRKKLGVFRLRLASSEEDAAMFESHILATATHADALQAQAHELGSTVDALQAAREADAAEHQAAMQQQARQYEVSCHCSQAMRVGSHQRVT